MKTYYKVTVPSDVSDGNVDLIIYAQTKGDERGVSFFLGIQEKTFDEQIQSLIIDFKKKFYINKLLVKIEKKEAQAKQLSKEYEDAIAMEDKEKILDRIILINQSIKGFMKEIRGIEKS